MLGAAAGRSRTRPPSCCSSPSVRPAVWQPQRPLDGDRINRRSRRPLRWLSRRSKPCSSRLRGFEWWAYRRSRTALRCSSGSVRIENELPTQDRALHPDHGLPGGSAPARPPPRAAPLDPRRASACGRSAGRLRQCPDLPRV